MKSIKKFICIFLIILLFFNTGITTIAVEENEKKEVNLEEKETENFVSESNNEILEDNTTSSKEENETDIKEENNEKEDIKNTEEITENKSEDSTTDKESISNETNLQNTIVKDESDYINTTVSEQVSVTKPNVTYRTHIQNQGWQSWKKNGEMSGTSGKSLRLEGIYINLENSSNMKIRYRTHIQDIGWQGWKNGNELSGTEGKSKRLEAIKIELQNSSQYSIRYRVHVENIGWQEWKYDGELAGTEGRGLRLEAIQIEIVNKVNHGNIYVDTNVSDVYYDKNKTVTVSGWKVSNLKDSVFTAYIDNKKIDNITYKSRNDVIKSLEARFGSANENPNPGFSFNVNLSGLNNGNHTLKIQLSEKGGKVLKTYTKTFKIDTATHVFYQTHIQDIGWQETKQDSAQSGTCGLAKRLEAIKINAVNLPKGVSLKYQTHIQDIGWQSWKNNNQISGTEGQSKRLEGIRIKLEGSSNYSVRYKVHVQDYGWQEWCYDGETAGTEGISKRLEAIEIQIVPKISNSYVEIFVDSPTQRVTNTTQNIKGWIMSGVPNTSLKIFIDDKELNLSNLRRERRQDVLNVKKGFGDEAANNPNPGFVLPVNFGEYSIGEHVLRIQVLSKNVVISELPQIFFIDKGISHEEGVYGVTGLKAIGDSRGRDLPYYRYGSGPNVFFATFAVHGFEDLWANDGWELAAIADEFYQTLLNSSDMTIHDKWTVYIFPGVNWDGLQYGYTNNGPGRTTLTSLAPGGRGIDLNRCWQTGSSYERFGDSRNYNGTEGFQAYEARYLRDFLLNHKSASGQTVLVDLHGWTQQLIGDSTVCSYYGRYFPENNRSTVGRYGNGYLINWARMSLGNSNRAAKSALIELPNSGVYNHQSVMNKNFYGKYIQATLDMLRGM